MRLFVRLSPVLSLNISVVAPMACTVIIWRFTYHATTDTVRTIANLYTPALSADECFFTGRIVASDEHDDVRHAS